MATYWSLCGYGRNAHRLHRPSVLAIALGVVGILSVGLLAGRATADDDRPNIVFILADDLGYGDLGCYGQTEILTPNIDRLAAQGTRFTQVYAGAAVCAPSRCVLMTGLHTGHARVRDNHGERATVPASETGQKGRIPLEPEDRTVAEVLKAAGYDTAIFGKWGLGEPGSTGIPNRQGFDQWLGFLNQDHAVDYFTPYLWQNEEKLTIAANEGGKRGQYVHDMFAERALAFLETSGSRPFFLYLPFTIPHANHEVPDLGAYANKPWSEAEKTYAAMVTRMDGDVGRILNRLRERHLEESTIVFFCSDNGAPGATADGRFHSGSDFRGQKGTFYEGGIRVPMIVRWPGKVPAGVVSPKVWYFADFLPTAGELAKAKVPPGLDGVSILPTLLGRSQELAGRLLYWENRTGQAARIDDWKAVRPAFAETLELYDLSRDPRETHELAAQNPAVVARIESAMKAARVPSANYPTEVIRKKAKRKADQP